MSRRTQSKGQGTNAEAAVLENDGWVWGVIFTIAGLSALSLAVLFSIATG
jgi:hypothetical protein